MVECEGQGWRLAWNPQRDPFPWLIGGEGWASELTTSEGQVLAKALVLVLGQHQSLRDTLMEEEQITLAFTGPVPGSPERPEGSLWLELSGDRHSWTLRFVLESGTGQRALEGFWARGAATAFAEGFSRVSGAEDGEAHHPGEP